MCDDDKAYCLKDLERLTDNPIEKDILPDKGKPVVRRGRKATGQGLP